MQIQSTELLRFSSSFRSFILPFTGAAPAEPRAPPVGKS